MCVRISMSFARVASSTAVIDEPRVRLAPVVPAAPLVPVPLVPVAAVSLPARFVMMRSMAATSVPQLSVPLADVVDPCAPRRAVPRLERAEAAGFSSAER